MKVIIFGLMLLSLGCSEKLIPTEETEVLFKKLLHNNLTDEEHKVLQDLIDIFKIDDDITSVIEYSTGTRNTLNCLLCRNIFATFFEGVQTGQSDEQIINTLTVLCASLGIESEKICSGAITLNLPIFTYIIRTTPEASPSAFCSFVLQNANNPNVCPHNDARFEWQVELPEPSTVEQTPPADTRPIKVAILTDAHVDPLYEGHGVANCDEPVCCRKGQSPASSFVYRSQIDQSVFTESLVNVSGKTMLDLDVADQIREMRHASEFRSLRNNEPAGYWGDYRSCDTPLWAFDDVVETIAENHPDVDLVYYVGDSIDHGVWETSYDLINEMNQYVIEKLRNTFGDNVPVVPVIGNHESQPTNQFAPSWVTGEGLNTTWLYEALANKWDHYLTEEAKASLRVRGDFSLLVRPGLRVISLNNNIAYRFNWWLVFDPTDAKTHLDWLVQELYRAELAGERVHLLTHIPPGVHDLTQTWTREFNRIINRFSSIITAEFNGHVHSDEFKIYYSLTDNRPINVAWGAGSATSYTNYNLNYKIATFDQTTRAPVDIVNYVYNLTEANLTPNRRPHWFQLYDVKHRYGLSDLTPTSMNDLVYRMVSNSQLLDFYAAFFSKLSDTRWPYCDNNCKIDYLCRTVVTVLYERQRCNELQNMFNARK